MLAARDLSFAYPRGRAILTSLTAEFPANAITAVVGPNGGGKSTLLRLLAGLLDPTGGSATLDARPVSDIPPPARARRLAYIAQRADLAFAYPVARVVAFGRFASGAGQADANARATAALARVGLAHRAGDPFAQLSAGQQQLAALARALVQLEGAPGDRYLVADEPMAAMDPAHARLAASLLRDLAGSGVGVVLVLHDLTLAARLADRALLLDAAGRPFGPAPSAQVLTPERLEGVLGVPFERVSARAGDALIPA